MAPKQSTARELRQRVLTCITKLSDRDTLPQAVSELESIIPTLTPDTFSLFINSLSSTSTADRSPVRVSSLKLLSSLSSFHRSSLSPHLPKLISAVTRRLRDPDSSVRSAASNATASFSSHISPSLPASIFRPLADSLASEQDLSAQSAAAICLSAAIDSSPSPDPAPILKLLPKWIKLLKCDAFKAKAALIALLNSALRVSEIGNCNLLRDLVNCLLEYLKSDDWAARKAAVDALKEIAVVERDNLCDMKPFCLKMIQSRKFDKVKAVREAMNHTLEAWSQVPDVYDDGSPPPPPPPLSLHSTKGNGRSAVEHKTPQTNKTARNRGKRPSPPLSSNPRASHYDCSVADSQCVLPSKQQATKTPPKDNSHPTRPLTNTPTHFCCHHKDFEDLSLIRDQLLQIQNQQSSLMDVLQKFIGSSQDGMRTLETRVHGLEQALDDISYDLALSTARISTAEATRSSCCLLPGSDFLSSKFWRRPEGRYSTSRFSLSGTTLASAMRSLADKRPDDTVGLDNRRFGFRGPRGVIMNPLAENPGASRVASEISTNTILRSVRNVA